MYSGVLSSHLINIQPQFILLHTCLSKCIELLFYCFYFFRKNQTTLGWLGQQR